MARNVNEAYCDTLYKLRHGAKEHTRNGEVRTIQQPFTLKIDCPEERVLFCPVRQANPYFHVMETVWMFAGSKDADFLLPFNRNIINYAEPNGLINGAYGHRWQNHFARNQIVGVVDELSARPGSRQAVIAMYDPNCDWQNHWKDRPCNTHIYFRMVQGRLDMTVCNRSNDAVWGMLGANIVHMTYLQELIAGALGVGMGRYFVVTNNLHIYEPHWHMLESPQNYDWYNTYPGLEKQPLINGSCDWYTFLYECRMFLTHTTDRSYTNEWLEGTVKPMYEHYMCRLSGDKHTYDINEVQAGDWRKACELWRTWNDN